MFSVLYEQAIFCPFEKKDVFLLTVSSYIKGIMVLV